MGRVFVAWALCISAQVWLMVNEVRVGYLERISHFASRPLDLSPLPQRAPPLHPPACDAYDWGSPPQITSSQRSHFVEKGYVVLPRFVDPAVVKILETESDAICAQARRDFQMQWDCNNGNSWLYSAVARDFTFCGPAAATASDLLQVNSLRLHQTAMITVQLPRTGNQDWHADGRVDEANCIYGRFDTKTIGTQLYLPLTRFDPENGTFEVCEGNYNNSTHPYVRNDGNCTDTIRPITLEPGDAVFFHPWLSHRTRPGPSRRKFWYARLIEGAARSTTSPVCNVEYVQDRVRTGTQSWCFDHIPLGEQVTHPCIPQLHPRDPDEMSGANIAKRYGYFLDSSIIYTTSPADQKLVLSLRRIRNRMGYGLFL